MSILLKLKILAVLATLSVTSHAQTSAWTVNAQDKTLSGLVTRWAQSEGRQARWEALADFPIADGEELNRVAKLSSAQSLGDAVSRLVNTLSITDANTDGAIGPASVGYFACFFRKGDVAVVVRSSGQPDCTNPL